MNCLNQDLPNQEINGMNACWRSPGMNAFWHSRDYRIYRIRNHQTAGRSYRMSDVGLRTLTPTCDTTILLWMEYTHITYPKQLFYLYPIRELYHQYFR